MTSTPVDYSKIAAALVKAVGENDESASVSRWLGTGFLPLDFAVSGRYDGGLPVGRIVEIFGPASCGKTALLTRAMIAAQQAGGIALFKDHEHAFSLPLAKKLGLDDTPGRWVYKKPRTFEDSLDTFVAEVRAIRDAGLPKDVPICAGFDSLASMIPKSQLERDLAKQGMHDQTALARATSPTFRVLASMAEEFNVCVVFLNQTRMKIGLVFGDPTVTPGGNAPEFYSSVRISLTAARLTQGEGEARQVVGQEVTAKVVKNKVSRPFLKAKWRFLFAPDGSGYFDATGSTLDFMVEKGLLGTHVRSIVWTDGNAYSRSKLVALVEASGGVDMLRSMLTASGVEADADEEAEREAKLAALGDADVADAA